MSRKVINKEMKRRLFRRSVSLGLSITMLLTSLYSAEFAGVFDDVPSIVRAFVSDDSLIHTREITSLRDLYQFSIDYNNDPDSWNDCEVTIIPTSGLILEDDHEFSVVDAEGKQVLDDDGNPVVEYLSYIPIGTKKPFRGRIILNQTSPGFVAFELSKPIFGTLYDSVEILGSNNAPVAVSLNRQSNVNTTDEPLFAEKVIHDTGSGSTPASWLMQTNNAADGNGYTFSGLIGAVGNDNDKTVVNIDFEYNSTGSVKAVNNAGLICGKINKEAEVNVTLSGSNTGFSVESVNGAAGGLVGEMAQDSKLNVKLATVNDSTYNLSDAKSITGATYAGGLVGLNDSGTLTLQKAVVTGTETENLDNEGNPIIEYTTSYSDYSYSSLGTITGGSAAGGIYGSYKANADTTFQNNFYVGAAPESENDDPTFCSISAPNAGGYIGLLNGNGHNIKFKGTEANAQEGIAASDLEVYVDMNGQATRYGGLVGSYTATALANSLEVDHVSVQTKASGSFSGDSSYGGIVGYINSGNGESEAYIKADQVEVDAQSGAANSSFFGGVVGNAGTKGSLLDIGTVTITTAGAYNGGGVVGKLDKGVLRLSGETNLTDAECSGISINKGQIVGYRTDALVYALGNGNAATASYGSGWRFVRSSDDTLADDIGTWGEVVRIADVESNIVTFDSAAHTVTLKDAVPAMDSPEDFVLTALNMQLNAGADIGALQFVKDTDGSVKNANKKSTLLSSTGLTVSGTIDLSGTGITGFMRDNHASKVDEIGLFTGTVTGSSNAKIDLAIGQRYGIYTETAQNPAIGRGAIFGHRYNGLFARTGAGAKINAVSVGGTVNVNAVNSETYVGGVVADVSNGITLTDVSVNETINYNQQETDKVTGFYVGGLIGAVDAESTSDITIQKSTNASAYTISPTINVKGSLMSEDDAKYVQCIAGGIGAIKSPKTFDISISDAQLSATVDASAATAAASVSISGLIGDIAYVGNEAGSDTRNLSLTNLSVKGTTVKSSATSSSGGILGFRWYNTNATMDAVSLTVNGSKENSLVSDAAHVGALVYKGTGHWTIGSEDLSISSLNITKTPTNSLGIILHDGHYNSSGVFLELTASDSFYLASGMTIPTMTGKVYDELCAYTASNESNLLLNSKNGVISYHTDGDFSMNQSTCNSYQNVYNTAVVNKFSRYYYNVDGTNRTAPANGWALLSWSLNRYAAANIKSKFANTFTGDVVTGTFDLNGISYYPIDVGAAVTLGDVTVKFYNEAIEQTELKGTTQKLTRNVGSQQYLMHCGLFKNITSTITTTGDLHFKGTIGKNSTYTGVMINGTLYGSLSTAEDKEIVLEGIKQYKTVSTTTDGETTISSSADNTGYLLINAIKSTDTTSPSMTLCGVRVGEADTDDDATNDEELYTSADATNGVARSLIGDAVGVGLDLNFKRIRLDARTSSSASGNWYGTDKSIFTNATLLNKFDVNQNSTGIYNYTYAQDWTNGHWVTYGKEITDSIMYSGEEKKYSGSPRYFTHPDEAPTLTSTEYDFSTGDLYLPYVYVWKRAVLSDATSNNPTQTYRELKVNVQTDGLSDGCGTYNHPYVISTEAQLISISQLMSNKNNFDNDMEMQLPLTLNSDNHWCKVTDGQCTGCAVFVYNKSTDKFTVKTATAGATTGWTADKVREYLAGAYYQIGGSFELVDANNKFSGLGSAAADSTGYEKYAFRGVIVGKTGNEVITNKTKQPLIKVSNGSVVRNFSIAVNTSADVVGNGNTTSDMFGYKLTDGHLYYGGVIGEIMGGDNIIDNVTVTYTKNANKSLSINSKNSYLSTVGGYVGVVVNGGLIFRNMKAANFDKSTFVVGDASNNYAASTNTAHLYINPYVGRVINGYAIHETTSTYSGDTGTYTLDNSTKNYRIADVIKNPSNKLSIGTYTAGDGSSLASINIPDGQSLFMLSLITQSGAGSATTAGGDYQYSIGYDGKSRELYNSTQKIYSSAENAATHLAQYNEVGTNSTTDYNITKDDKVNENTAIPYIIYNYTGKVGETYPARTVTGNTYFINLSNTTDKYVYNLPDCFRGIGSLAPFANSDTISNITKYFMEIYGVKGSGTTSVNLNLDYKTYSNSTDNYINTLYAKDDKDNNYRLLYNGFGLFNNFRQIAKDTTITNKSYNLNAGYYIGDFSIAGSVKVEEYNSTGTRIDGSGLRLNNSSNISRRRYTVGGLVGGVPHTSYINLYKLNLDNLTVSGKSSSAVGGYIGRANTTESDKQNGQQMSNIFVNACNTKSTFIEATNSACGGVLGLTYSGFTCMYINTAPYQEDGSENEAGEDGEAAYNYKGVDEYYRSTMQLSISNESETQECGTGGILGGMRNGYNVYLWINNVTIEGYAAKGAKLENTKTTKWEKDSDDFAPGVGGLIGYVRKANNVIVTNCTIKNINIKGRFAGGLFGNIAYYNQLPAYGVSPKISIYNCKVFADAKDDNGTAISYTIEGVNFAGGLSGQFITDKDSTTKATGYDEVTDKYVYDIDGCEVYNYSIVQSGTGNNMGVGGIIGFANNGNRTIVNTRVHDCTIKTTSNGSHGMGGIVGYTNKNIYGYNISSYDNTFADYSGGTTTAAKYGNFLGYNNGTQTIKIVGFSRARNIFDNGTDAGKSVTVENGTANSTSSYIVNSDYSSAGTSEDHGTEMSGITKLPITNNGKTLTNVSEGVAEDYFPYATVSPVHSMGDTSFLTGDGMAMYTRYTRKEAVDENGDPILDNEDNPTYVVENGEYVYNETSTPLVMAIYDDQKNTGAEYNNTDTVKEIVNPQIYSNVPDSALTKINEMIHADSNAEAFLTTFDAEVGLPTNFRGDDFPILAIGGRLSNDYTDEINAYIQAITNTSVDYTAERADNYRIDILQCRYINHNYQIYTPTNAQQVGLKLDSGHYIMNDNYADTVQSGKQFTLIDVQFYDPTSVPTYQLNAQTKEYEVKTSGSVAYHVYVPVLTKKMVRFQFFSAALQGSDYVSDKYTSKFGNKIAGNFDSWQTMFISYTYPVDQIQAILNTGKGLMWNNSKIIELQYGAQQDIADSTQFVLIDNNNNADKEYYLTKASVETEQLVGHNATDILDLQAFTTKRSGATTLGASQTFTPQNLNDFAGKNVRYSTNVSNTGNYAETVKTDPDCVAYAYDELGSEESIKYFKTALGEGAYDLNYVGTDPIVETYYISMYAFGKDNYYDKNNSACTTNDAYGFTITSPLTLEGNVMSKRANNLNEYANATIFLGKLFEQTLVLSDYNEDLLMQPGNNSLNVTLTSTVKFIEGANAAYFHRNLASNKISLYQGFLVYLNRYGDGGSLTNDSKIYTEPSYTYTNQTDSYDANNPDSRVIGENYDLPENSPYLFIPPIEIVIPKYDDKTTWIGTQTATATLDFSNDQKVLEVEFPTRSGNSKAGIGFYASANIEYSADRVEYSNQTYSSSADNRRYRIEKTQKADLTLTALDQDIADGYDQYGEQSKNRSPLGINARYLDTGLKYEAGKDYEHIDISVNFDVDNLPKDTIFDGSYSILFDVKLEQKQNSTAATGYTYSQVDMNTFLRNYQFISKDTALTGTTTDGGKAYQYSIELYEDQDDWEMDYVDGQFTGRLSFDVYTADYFEKSIAEYLYSNYKITMTGRVVKTKDIGSGYEGDTDGIVYTNAKINAMFVDKAS